MCKYLKKNERRKEIETKDQCGINNVTKIRI